MKFDYNTFIDFMIKIRIAYNPKLSRLNDNVIEDIYRNYSSRGNYKLLGKKESVLERHFDTAALMVSTINSNILVADKTIKEEIAIFVGISALINHIERDDKDDADSGFIVFLENNKNFFEFPQGYLWELHWAGELHDAHVRNEISIKSLAKELFWLEKYNRLKSQI